jgi:hypothetical protein
MHAQPHVMAAPTPYYSRLLRSYCQQTSGIASPAHAQATRTLVAVVTPTPASRPGSGAGHECCQMQLGGVKRERFCVAASVLLFDTRQASPHSSARAAARHHLPAASLQITLGLFPPSPRFPHASCFATPALFILPSSFAQHQWHWGQPLTLAPCSSDGRGVMAAAACVHLQSRWICSWL